MIVWVDAHLSPRIARWLSSQFTVQAVPVRNLGMREATDQQIFEAALAFDQSRRLAKVIHETSTLRGKVSAGLYVGEREQVPHTTMGPEHLITDREALRERSSHILLTNYKMLDFLIIRLVDRRLWRHNQPRSRTCALPPRCTA